MAAFLLNTICALTLMASAAIALVGYGESRAADQCFAMVTKPDGK